MSEQRNREVHHRQQGLTDEIREQIRAILADMKRYGMAVTPVLENHGRSKSWWEHWKTEYDLENLRKRMGSKQAGCVVTYDRVLGTCVVDGVPVREMVDRAIRNGTITRGNAIGDVRKAARWMAAELGMSEEEAERLLWIRVADARGIGVKAAQHMARLEVLA